MHQLYYQPEGYVFGDCMPFGKDGKFYLYHQRDKRNPGSLGEPFGWSLATTSDFVTYEDHGIAIPRGSDEEQDQFIFAGSVFEDREGQYHAFYTGYNRDYVDTGKPSQVLMHAVSGDLLHWEKTQEDLGLAPQEGYDKNDWRDPFVLWNEEDQEYLLILGGRKLDGQKVVNGCTVFFTSPDLKKWKFGGPFWAPEIYTMHEMPDLFKIGEWWYLIISEYSDKNKMIYRMSKSLKGPWLAPTDDAFDGRAYYAGRTFCLDGRRILFGWVPTKEEEDDARNYQWGGALVPHEIYQREDGTLGCKPVETLWRAFEDWEKLPEVKLQTVDRRETAVLAESCGDLFAMEADFVFKEGTRAFSLSFGLNPQTGEAHEFKFYVGENRYVSETFPNQPWFRNMNLGQTRPIVLQAGERYHVQLIVDDTIATAYVNGVAMNTRAYQRFGNCIGAAVIDGGLEVTNASISRNLSRK